MMSLFQPSRNRRMEQGALGKATSYWSEAWLRTNRAWVRNTLKARSGPQTV